MPSEGTFWYGALPNRKDEKALLLMTAFDEVVREQAIFRQSFGILRGDDSGARPQARRRFRSGSTVRSVNVATAFTPPTAPA
jgi:hypothetical protein